MKNLLLLIGVCTIALLSQTNVTAQNVFSGEPVQWAGRPNGYSTTPYGTDYRTTIYRKVSTTATNPTDGRAQWTTTINVQSSGGDIAPDNMPGGGGAGWLLISGPSGNRFQNKWNFNGVGQAALNSINGIIKQDGGQDMGLNMGTAGRYTFNMRDAGYVNTEVYIGFTTGAPVTVSRTGQTFSSGQAVVNISTGATPSSGENVYVRYRVGTNDFTSGTSVVQATGSGTSWSANIPALICGSTYYYYVYTSTRTLSQINAHTESERSLATLRYDDAFGANYSFTVSPVPTAGITNNSGTNVLTCAAPSISVTATGGDSYSWDNGLGNLANASISAPGTFTVTATAANGCTDQENIIITQDLSNNTFTGTGLWSDGARWSCGAAPASGDNVTIASGANATLDVDFTVGGTLALTSTSTLTVNPAITLTISGSANFGGQSVTLLSSGSGTASLGQVTGTLTGATNVTVERYIPNNGFRSWRLLSVPVATTQSIRQAWQEGDANPLPKQNNLPGRGTHITGVFASQALAAAAGFDSVTAQPGMQYWAGTAWGNITSTTQPINNYPAYFLFIRGNRGGNIAGSTSSSAATTLRTTGTVYTGDQLTNIGASAFAVVANVYPSAINFTGLERTGGVSNLFYIWDSKKLNGTSLGMYQTFSSTNSFNALIAGGSYVQGQPNTTIESGQAFFVKSTTAGSITLKETAKVSSSGSLGFRPSPSAISSKLDTRLYNSAEEMLDANTVVFDAVYSKAVAAEDAPKLGNPGWNFAIETAGKLLAVEGTVPVKENEVIQYRMWNMQAGTYRLEVQATNLHVPAGTTAVLEDSYLQTATELNATGSTDVQFTVDQNPASSSANRFRVVFAKGKAAAESKQGYTIAPNPVESGVMNVVFANKAAGRYSVRILGSNGQSAAVRTVVHAGGTANQAISLPATMGSGTYTVEIIAPDKSRTTTIAIIK